MSNTSSISICSNALILLGSQPISSFTDGSDRSKAVGNLYEFAQEEVLRSHPWNAATKRALLSPLVGQPAFDFRYVFQLPGDWLRTIQVGKLECPIEYTIEGRQILCDVQSLPLVYVWRNTVESTWDATLVSVMTYYMKAAMAYWVTQSTTQAQQAAQEFLVTLRQAKSINGQDEGPQTLGDFPLLVQRQSGWPANGMRGAR
ncbi:MAG: hypothetical protein VB143_07590 [Burkholderia sp.]